jgi:CRISPR/Cas system endoribonuclease Cas6 (RAMP superfamily)
MICIIVSIQNYDFESSLLYNHDSESWLYNKIMIQNHNYDRYKNPASLSCYCCFFKEKTLRTKKEEEKHHQNNLQSSTKSPNTLPSSLCICLLFFQNKSPAQSA